MGLNRTYAGIIRKIIGLAVLVFLLTGWGKTGHRVINRNVVVHLPSSMGRLIEQAAFFANRANDADIRKSNDPTEDPKHFIDLDDYAEFATHTVPHDLDSLIAKYGASHVDSNGLNPWATISTIDSLTAQLRRGDWQRAWQSVADLGHYVGDAHQPLHVTKYYGGSTNSERPGSGSGAIHSRYETNLISRDSLYLVITPHSVQYIQRPIDFVFGYLYDSNAYVDSVYDADILARQSSGWSGSGSPPASYYTALWDRSQGFTKMQFQRATQDFADLIYTAWTNAGSPDLTKVPALSGSESIPAIASLNQNFPNPFNPGTTIAFRLQRQARVSLAVYSLSGHRIAVLMDRTLPSGSYRSDFDASDYSLASGLYLYRLDVLEGGRRTTLSNKMLYLK